MGLVQSSSLDRRFFHLLGASMLDRTICSMAGTVGMRMSVGANIGADAEGIPESDLVLLWGTNTLTSNPHLWPFVLEARKRGAPIIAIDPLRTRTAAQCDEWIGIRPGTDAALALGIMHVLFARGLEDREYLTQHTLGEDGLRARVREYAPERVANITGVPSEKIMELAERYGRSRAAFIRVNYGLQRHAGGGMAVRTIACLPAITGHWRRAGGGVQLSTSANFQFNKHALERPDLSPPVRTINMIRLGEALTTVDAGVGGPPVRALVVYNSNPAAVAPDRNAVLRGLAREDLFAVVLEHFQTDTADWADIVLPATTQLEHLDVHSSYGHLYALANNPAIAPLGEAKPNTEVFRLLAARMGFDEACFAESDESMAANAFVSGHSRMAGIDWGTLKTQGWQRLNVPSPYAPFAEGNFPTPSGKCEFYSESLRRQGLDPLPTYTPPRESAVSDPALARRFPLAMLSPPARNALNSTFGGLPVFLETEKTPWLDIDAGDAAARGISDGDKVRVYNDRGALVVTARITDRTRPGVVVAPSIWWRKLSPDGTNANMVTGQALTDMGRAATFYDVLVEVARVEG
jgi:anaerobic selenocysteine-containing dehydrogenase